VNRLEVLKKNKNIWNINCWHTCSCDIFLKKM
jgi:hypothetical protein